MHRRKTLPVGAGLLLCFLIFGVALLATLSSTNLLRNGVPAQGVVTGITLGSCGKSGSRPVFSVQFTDRAGQEHTSVITQCVYRDFDASVGDSVALVYLPDDPTQIAPPDSLLRNVKLGIIVTVFAGIITLILLILWVRKRIRKSRERKQLKYSDASSTMKEYSEKSYY